MMDLQKCKTKEAERHPAAAAALSMPGEFPK